MPELAMPPRKEMAASTGAENFVKVEDRLVNGAIAIITKEAPHILEQLDEKQLLAEMKKMIWEKPTGSKTTWRESMAAHLNQTPDDQYDLAFQDKAKVLAQAFIQRWKEQLS